MYDERGRLVWTRTSASAAAAAEPVVGEFFLLTGASDLPHWLLLLLHGCNRVVLVLVRYDHGYVSGDADQMRCYAFTDAKRRETTEELQF